MRKLSLLVFFILLLHLSQIIFSQRSYFLSTYDAQYWKDRYEHSQYVLPLSKRIIGDDGLYAYASYRLISGDNPFSINDNKPPLGLYLIGLFILLSHNSAFFALFFGVGSMVIFYLIAAKIIGRTNALFSVAFLSLDPLFFSQFWKPWLDIPQLFFLLLNVLFLLYIPRSKKKFLLVFFSGLSLGLFAEIKPPLILPLILLLESIYIFREAGKKEFLVYLTSIFLGIVLPYLRYMQLGNSLLDVVRVHKYMTSIYVASKTNIHFDAIWKTLFLGSFPDISSSFPIKVSEWWPLWPIATITSIAYSFIFFLKKKTILKGFSVFLLVTLFVYTVIPSYPRYLILILPVLYLFFTISVTAVFKSSKLKNTFFIVIILYGVFNAFFYLKPNPGLLLDNFYYNLSNQYFQDIYEEDLAKEKPKGFARKDFRFLAQKTFRDASIKEVKVETMESNIPESGNKGIIHIRMIYTTQDLGKFEEEKNVELIKESGQWKISWSWDIILNKFLPDYSIEQKIRVGKRGSILSSDGKILAEDKIGSLIYVNPDKIDTKKEQNMLGVLEKYNFNRGGVELQNAYLENSLPNEFVPILTPNIILTSEEKNQLLSYPGITLSDHATRVFYGIDPKTIKNTQFNECCTRIYSSYSYHGVKGAEKNYDKILAGYNGGNIRITDKTGRIIRVVLENIPKDGKDVTL